MKVLIAHNTYQHAGGEDVVVQQEGDLLRRMGHEVIEYRRSNHELGVTTLGGLSALKDTLWSSQSYREIQELTRDRKPDVAHFHNTFMLISPASYYACRRSNVPVVQTLHNYRLWCPRADFYRNHSICELCLGKTPWPGILHGCYRDSRLQTAGVAMMLTMHRSRRTWQSQVDSFVAPTEFLRTKAVQGGIPADKIVVKPHFVYPDPGKAQRNGDYALFVGRLSREKGLVTLLNAWKGLSGLKLKLVGAVGDDPTVLELIRSRDVNDVEVFGQVSRDAVLELLKGAAVLIFPSVLYESFGLSIVEAYACGVPVIASRLGAMAEIVKHGSTGLLFTAADSVDLAEKVKWAVEHPDEMNRMGLCARQAYSSHYTAEHNYKMLMSIYDKAIAGFAVADLSTSTAHLAPSL